MKINFLLFAILLLSVLSSCQKDYGVQVIDLINKVNALQNSRDSIENAILLTNANITSLQKSRDSLNKVLGLNDSVLNKLNITNTSIIKSLDSIKTQLLGINTQITSLSSQLTSTNVNVTSINSQLLILNQQYSDLLIRFNTLITQLNNIAPLSLTNGLIAYYPFTGNANDSSGNGYNGTVSGATLTTDRFGTNNSAYSFSKVNSNFISLPLLTTLNGAKTASFSFWVLTTSLSNNGTIFGHWSNNNGGVGINCGITIEQQYVNGGIGIYNYSGTGGILSPTFSINKWHHVVINLDFNQTTNTNKIMVYIDNSLQSLSYGLYYNIIGVATSSFIGRRNTDFNTYGVYFDGLIDNFRIYNRILNLDEINYLATH